jgi:hypothetical protein
MTTSRGKILQEKTSAGLARFLIPAKVVLGNEILSLKSMMSRSEPITKCVGF